MFYYFYHYYYLAGEIEIFIQNRSFGNLARKISGYASHMTFLSSQTQGQVSAYGTGQLQLAVCGKVI